MRAAFGAGDHGMPMSGDEAASETAGGAGTRARAFVSLVSTCPEA